MANTPIKGTLSELKEDREQAAKEYEKARKIIDEMGKSLPDDLKKGFIPNTKRKTAFEQR